MKITVAPITNTSRQSGFALIISLSLMAFVLLLLLSITTLVQVETSGSQVVIKKMESEQNAMLALYQAIGTLQKEMGPDQRISANADILDSGSDPANDNALVVEHPYLVGVWDSSGDKLNETVTARVADNWQVGETVNYPTRAQDGFRRWLISTPQTGSLDPTLLNLASNGAIRDESDPDFFKLLGAGVLQPDGGGTLSAALQKKELWAPLVPIDPSGVSSEFSNGRFGWVVMDEGVKARLNQPLRTNGASLNDALQLWDNPGSVGIEAIGMSGEFAAIERDSDDLHKVTNFKNASFLLSGTGVRDTIGPYYHDVSLNSRSVLSNVVDGGLRLDLSMLADESPSEYASKRLYSDADTGSSINVEADPHWSAILDYVNLYKDGTRLADSGSPTQLPVASVTNVGWTDTLGAQPSIDLPLPAPKSHRIAPAIAQVEMYFSLVAAKPHLTNIIAAWNGPEFYVDTVDTATFPDQDAASIANNGVRQIFLCVSPVITLYNPYNLPLEFNELWVVMRDPPIGLKFSRYNHEGSTADPDIAVPATHSFASLSQMMQINFATDEGANLLEQRFNIKITNDAGLVRIEPGATQVFSPKYDDNLKVKELSNAGGVAQFELVAVPGYDEGVGIYWDQLLNGDWTNETFTVLGDTSTTVDDERVLSASMFRGVLGMKTGDRIKILMNLADGTKNHRDLAPDVDTNPRNGTFPIEMYSSDPRIGKNDMDESADANLIGRYVFDYNTGSIKGTSEENRLELLAKSASVKGESYDDIDEGIVVSEDLSYDDLYTLENLTQSDLRVNQIVPTTFAVFRVGGKVTQEDTEAAYHPSLAWAQTNPANFAGHYDVGEVSSAYTGFDMSIIGSGGGLGSISPSITTDNEGYFFSGHTQMSGVNSGTQYEVPVAPLQSIASLQHANISGGGYLPQVSYAAGNSWAHPLINSSSATGAGVGGVNYGLYDHSYLSNFRLWDRYYFSTLTSEQSVFDQSGGELENVFNSWIIGGDLPNPSLRPFFPVAEDEDTARSILMAGSSPKEGAYRKVAAYQVLDGGFNINSTSVEAWKALLSASNIAQSTLQVPSFSKDGGAGALELRLSDSADGAANVAAVFSRFRISNFNQPLESSLGNPTFEDLAMWQGYRELDEAEVSTLAAEIVKQIRHRGPFLSMAEFVNRRLVASSDARSKMGVLDAAIQAAGLNADVELNAGAELDQVAIDYLNDNDYGMTQHSEVLAGNSAKGIPAFLAQADILQQVGAALAARSDTFAIRAYGEATNLSGSVVSYSVCEAVLQRLPDYVDSSQEPYHDEDTGTVLPDGLSAVNERFGRQFRIVDFRWLDSNEI